MTVDPPAELRLGNLRVDALRGCVERDGRVVAIEPRVLELLLYFLSRPGELVTKEEVVREAWGAQALSDDTVWRAVSHLRRALGTGPQTPRIETVPRRGYIFEVPLPATRCATAGRGDGVARQTALGPVERARRSARLRVAVLLCAAAVAVPREGPGSASTAAGATIDDSSRAVLRRAFETYAQLTPASFARAQGLFDQVLARDEGNPRALFGLVSVAVQQGRSAEALRVARRAVELYPEWAGSHASLGFALMADGKLTAAAAAYRAALQRQPGMPVAWRRLCALELRSGRLALGVRCSAELWARVPAMRSGVDGALILSKAAVALDLLGEAEAAQRLARRALALDPSELEAAGVLAAQRAGRGDLEGARRLLAEAAGGGVAPLLGAATALQLEQRYGTPAVARRLAEEMVAAPEASRGDVLATHVRLRLASLLVEPEPRRARELAEQVRRDATAAVESGSERWGDFLHCAAAAGLLGDPEGGLAGLARTIELGFLSPDALEGDPILAPLRRHSGFARLRRRVADRLAEERERLGSPPTF